MIQLDKSKNFVKSEAQGITELCCKVWIEN